MRHDNALAAINGTLIGAAFGRVWLSWAGEGLPGWQPILDAVGWVALAVFVIVGATVALRGVRTPPQPRGKRLSSARMAWFAVVIPLEVALIAVGQHLLGGSLARPEWIPVWTMFVVGTHFWPFALILRVSAFHTLAGGLCVVAAVSAFAAGLVGVASLWFVLPGLGGASVLWGFAGWPLNAMARGRSLASELN